MWLVSLCDCANMVLTQSLELFVTAAWPAFKGSIWKNGPRRLPISRLIPISTEYHQYSQLS